MRVVSALVLLPVGIGSIWVGGVIWAACLSTIVAGLCAEWVLLWRARSPRRAFGLPILAAGLLYILFAYAALLALRAGPEGRLNVLFVMVVVWSDDIGAYAAGRLFGGPRLAPSISPGKTWAGAAGGLLCAVLAGCLIGHARAAPLALGLGCVAIAGDLLESAIKRRFGAKDSGWIIPGHGGLLDRLDGVLAAAPAAFVWSMVSGPGPLWG